MTKAQLSIVVSDKLGISRKDAMDAVDATLTAITDAVAMGIKVSFPGFGTFEKVDRQARTARNPRTGEAVEVPPTSTPKFKPAQAFKDAVNS